MADAPDVDPRIASAISHWSPRFVANGVPLSDFEDVTGSLSRWEDWCAAWSARAEIHETLGREALAAGNTISAGEHLTRAAVCFHFGKFLFVNDLGQMREAGRRAVACRTDALPLLDPPGERVAVPYEGTHLYGNLRRPAGSDRPPVVVMCMGLDSTKEEMHDYEQRFLRRGLATFAFDGPGQGEAEHDLALCPEYERPVAAVIDHLETRDDLDTDRLALWGVSLGGYFAARAACFERRAKACVSLSGAYERKTNFHGRPPLNIAAFLHRAKVDDIDAAAEVSARMTLRGHAANITCPLYIVAGTEDRITPASEAEKLAAEAGGDVVLDVVEGGNHVVNNYWYRYRDQTADWLADHLA
ncbi:MAG TPA: alpha/beta fold hydrolase [Egicoccus sp.]|nr:alpha/beta fold hydrolase [Egicoccus sp.]HSK22946.1 alpha/beta fold hydrolase [Egicoccus sp.]